MHLAALLDDVVAHALEVLVRLDELAEATDAELRAEIEQRKGVMNTWPMISALRWYASSMGLSSNFASVPVMTSRDFSRRSECSRKRWGR